MKVVRQSSTGSAEFQSAVSQSFTLPAALGKPGRASTSPARPQPHNSSTARCGQRRPAEDRGLQRDFSPNGRVARDRAKLCRAPRSAQSGVALVITLILLSVITFMAIAFLVLSRGQKTSTTTATDMAIAGGMAEGAQARAVVEMIAPVLAMTNPFNYTMLVSTNYISPVAYVTGNTSPTNVNYVGRNGAPLTGKDALQNLENLLYNPRPPVFITNRSAGSNEFRYYLDLNRNGLFDPSGWVGVTNSLGQGLVDQNRRPILNYQQGDPQWIGALEFPDRPHGPNNRFVGRYAYLVVPISQALDINYIHNQARRPEKTAIDATGADFLRNQGVGPWEINLASFLYDLNTNVYAWGGQYIYQPLGNSPFIKGNAFVDACAILTSRYGGPNYPASLASVAGLYANGRRAFDFDHVDGYTGGPILTTASTFGVDPDTTPERTIRPWPGADNTNHFFSTQDLFDPAKTSTHFVTALVTAGAQTNTYDRNTFYRLLSQLGTDSAPDPATKININYDNLVQKNVQGITSATNFFPWEPLPFFTNTANALLANAGYNFTITNIQIYPTNFYTASIHRLLQLAVNIYDSSTNRAFITAQQYPYCPTVLRPLFRRTTLGTNSNVIIIAGFREVIGKDFAYANTGPPIVELDTGVPGVNAQRIPQLGVPFRIDRLEPMISGMPLVIGVKKGFPNFNEFSMQTYMYLTRLLEFRRDTLDGPVKHTNQMYVVALTNSFGMEGWNSYSNTYPRNLEYTAVAQMTAIITNELGRVILSNRLTRAIPPTPVAPNTWRGWQDINHTVQSFLLPFGRTNFCIFITNSTLLNQPANVASTNSLIPQTPKFDRSGQFYQPIWWLNLNTRVRFILVDTDAQRIVDYVNINNWEQTIDLTKKLTEGASCQLGDLQNPAEQWCTNRQRGSFDTRVPTIGILNQIAVGLTGTTDWNNFSMDPYAGQDMVKAMQSFRYNLINQGTPGASFGKSNVFYAPFDPYKPLFVHTSWQANDPLVHYTIGDLVDLSLEQSNQVDNISRPLDNLAGVNHRYEPWGGPPFGTKPSMPAFQIAAKDPLVTRPDDWAFPTNKFPNIGWLGRVHRGTPWQTVYLKSPNILLQAGSTPVQNLGLWQKWTGNPQVWGAVTNVVSTNSVVTNLVPVYPGSLLAGVAYTFPDALYSTPTNDWKILDLFTTALNENATRGQLSVNQTNLAAWSAVLAGVNVLSNLATSTFIEPAGVYDPLATAQPPVVRILNGIINSRTNFPNNTYQHLGDILATPELTVRSPYVAGVTNVNSVGANDAVYERIPQQILGLLRSGDQPRFLIYSYGQALKPAPRSVIPSSLLGNQFVNLCTNYQITAEVATRAVVRIDGAPKNPRAVIESFNVLPPD